MYSLPKGKLLVSNQSAYVHDVKRLANSHHGNPQYEIWFSYEKDSTLSDFSAKTKANAMWVYSLSSFDMLGKKYDLTITKPRKNLYINEMIEVQDV